MLKFKCPNCKKHSIPIFDKLKMTANSKVSFISCSNCNAVLHSSMIYFIFVTLIPIVVFFILMSIPVIRLKPEYVVLIFIGYALLSNLLNPTKFYMVEDIIDDK